MSSGDMTVVGMVSDTHLIEDIGVYVPKGVAVTIPGHLTLISKDLHRALSQRHLFPLHNPPTTVPAMKASAGLAKEERERLEAEIQRLEAQNEALEARNALLENQVTALQLENHGLKEKDSKLDAILSAINERPMVTQVVQSVTATGSKPAQEEAVSGNAPMFIPAQIRPEGVEERVAVQEETSTSSSVSSAADKLKQMRKGKTQ